MSTLLADAPPAAPPEEPPAPGSSEAPPESPAPVSAQPTCRKCGASMEDGQEWCLQCGAGVPGSLATGSPSWRATATVLTATAILVLGAATAAYAALTKPSNTVHRQVTIAQVPAATPATPTTPTTAATPTPPPATSTPTASTPVPPLTTDVKPPKIPLTVTPTPKSTSTTKSPTPANTPVPPVPKTTPKASKPKSEPQLTPVLLDTNAVTTYNPSGDPPETFGDPSLTIDGDTATAWTALVNPALAPKMAAGLLVDMNAPQKLAALELITSTPGMTVQVFGANGTAAPATITAPGWVALSQPAVQKERHDRIKLTGSSAFRFVVLWITGAPAGSVGTPQAPGRVSVNELEALLAR